jgi:hypothetical protein
MTPSLIGSAAYLYPLAIQQAEALARTPSTARLLTFSHGLATMLVKTRGDARAVALCLLSPEYAIFSRVVEGATELIGLRLSEGQPLFLPIKSVLGVSPRYSSASGKTGYALRAGAEYREHIFPSGPIYLQRSGFALREGPGSVGLTVPVRVGAVAARQADFDYFAFGSSLSDGAMLSQGFTPDTGSEPLYDSESGRLPVGLSSLRGALDPYSGAELTPQTSFRPEDAGSEAWPAASGRIVDGATVHPALYSQLEYLARAFQAQQGVWEIDGEAWSSESVIVPSMSAVPTSPSSSVGNAIATYDASVTASSGDYMNLSVYSIDEDRWGRFRTVAGGAVFSALLRLARGDDAPVAVAENARHNRVPSEVVSRVVGVATFNFEGHFAGYQPRYTGKIFSSAYVHICDGSPHEKLLMKLRASEPGGDYLTPFNIPQPPSMEVGASGMDWYSLLREGDSGQFNHALDVGGDVVLYDLRTGAETTLVVGPTSSVANKFQMFGVSGASIIVDDVNYHLVAEGRNVASPTVVVVDDDFGVPRKNWEQGSRVPLSTSWSLLLRRGAETIALANGGGSALGAWGGADSPPIYASSSISSTVDYLFDEDLAAGRFVSNVANVAILSAVKIGREAFAVVRVGIALTQADGDYNSPPTVLQRVAFVALDREAALAAPLFPTMGAAQWDAVGSFSDARVVPMGDELVCVFSNGMAANLRQAIAPPGGAARSFEFLSTSPQDISGLTFIGASSPCGVRSNKVPEFPAFEGQAQ